MRSRYAFIVVLIALVVLTTMSVIGQEEPLPPVRANARVDASAIGTTLPPAAYVSLVVEPLRETLPTTLADAARNNDYASFNALFEEARRAGRNVAAYDTLHQLWSWSMNDPIGAFYGAETHERLRAAYPGYAAYIEDFRIVDRRGAVFYPTSETRSFLLDRALAGNAPRVLLAETTRGNATGASIAENDVPRAAASNETVRQPVARQPVTTTARREASRQASEPRTTAAVTTRRQTGARNVSETAAATKQTPATPASTATAPALPAVPTASAAIAATAPVQAPAPLASDASLPTPAPARDAPAASSAVDPLATPAVSPVEDAPATTPIARESVFADRGLLLLIIGIVGIGLLAVMLRAPQELPTSIMPNGSVPPEPAKDTLTKDTSAVKPETGATVEPMRRPKKHAGGSR